MRGEVRDSVREKDAQTLNLGDATLTGTVNAAAQSPAKTLAYRTGCYVGALYGYQLISEVSPVDGPDFCQGFADGIEIIISWLRRYLADGGTFESALGDLMPYFPTLRTWVGDATSTVTTRPVRPPNRRERQRREWERVISSVLDDDHWQTSKEVAERLNGRGPHSLRSLNQVLQSMATTGDIERLQTLDLANARSSDARWRLRSASGRPMPA